MARADIINAHIAFQERLTKLNYSKTIRFAAYKGGSADCSSLQAQAMCYAGLPLLDKNKGELLTSTYQVNDPNWELIYPAKLSDIGKTFVNYAKAYGSKKPEKGDLVFFSFNHSSTRANKITHIAAVRNEKEYIHTGNNTEKLCTKPISTYGSSNIVAVMRLKSGVTEIARPTLKAGSTPKYVVRMLQARLNHTLDCKLTVDGVFGSGTTTQLNNYKKQMGLPQDGICDNNTWNKLFGSTSTTPIPTPTPDNTLGTDNLSANVTGIKTSLNVRSGPGTSYKVLGTLKNGAAVIVTKKDYAKGWHQVNHNGKAGYVSSAYIKTGTLAPIIPSTDPSISRLLKIGYSGEDVLAVKRWLFNNNWYTSNIKQITNITFGNDTLAAVKRFQKFKKLAVDGIVGKNTITAMGGKWTGK